MLFDMTSRREQKAAIPESQLGSSETRMGMRWHITNLNNNLLLSVSFLQVLRTFFPLPSNVLPLLQTLTSAPDILNCSMKWKSEQLFPTYIVLKLFDLEKNLHASSYFFQLLLWLNLSPHLFIYFLYQQFLRFLKKNILCFFPLFLLALRHSLVLL